MWEVKRESYAAIIPPAFRAGKAGGPFGKLREKVVPFFSDDSNQTRPPEMSTIVLTT